MSWWIARRNAASVLARSDDQSRLKQWVEAISPVDHQLLAFLGVAEGLSAPAGEPGEQSPSAIAAAE